MSHAALTLILERGRPVTRRVLAASSPLYQPMDGAERLGYEVRVYARVPDTGDGADRAGRGGLKVGREREKEEGKRKRAAGAGHKRIVSTGGSTESDPGSAGGVPAPAVSGKGHSRSTSLTTSATSGGGQFLSAANVAHSGGPAHTNSPLAPPSSAGTSAPGGPGTGTPQRVRYREQGVDELLQLKLLQAISSVDEDAGPGSSESSGIPGRPPPGSTIVLATGDGNVGQFNEEGFRGCVRTALRRGWRVELYAWEGGMSRSWLREFGGGAGAGSGGGGGGGGGGSAAGSGGEEGQYGDRFRIVGLEKFAQDLLDIP